MVKENFSIYRAMLAKAAPTIRSTSYENKCIFLLALKQFVEFTFMEDSIMTKEAYDTSAIDEYMKENHPDVAGYYYKLFLAVSKLDEQPYDYILSERVKEAINDAGLFALLKDFGIESESSRVFNAAALMSGSLLPTEHYNINIKADNEYLRNVSKHRIGYYRNILNDLARRIKELTYEEKCMFVLGFSELVTLEFLKEFNKDFNNDEFKRFLQEKHSGTYDDIVKFVEATQLIMNECYSDKCIRTIHYLVDGVSLTKVMFAFDIAQ